MPFLSLDLLIPLIVLFGGTSPAANLPKNLTTEVMSQVFQYQEGMGPFLYNDHYISGNTGIVFTLYNSNEYMANFMPNFRGISATTNLTNPRVRGGWEREFFCEPDYAVGAFGEGDDPLQSVAYFPALRWHQSIYFDRERRHMVVSYRYQPENGWLQNSPYYHQVKAFQAPPLHMEIHFRWLVDRQIVEVYFKAVNRHQKNLNLNLVFQDAAYMWFPEKSQRDVGGFLWRQKQILKEDHLIERPLAEVASVTYSKTHGVISGFHHKKAWTAETKPPDLGAAGIGGAYLMLPRYVPVGYRIKLGRDGGRNLERLVRIVQRRHAFNEKPFLSRYLAYQFKRVPPQEAVNIQFNLVMGVVDPKNQLEEFNALFP